MVVTLLMVTVLSCVVLSKVSWLTRVVFRSSLSRYQVMFDAGNESTLQVMLTGEPATAVCSPERKVILGESSQRKQGTNTNNMQEQDHHFLLKISQL